MGRNRRGPGSPACVRIRFGWAYRTGSRTVAQMDNREKTPGTVRFDVRNVGGITRATVGLDNGVTVLSGENASNKSSLLRAIAGVLGGPVPRVKTDEGRGRVEMSAGDDEYTLELAADGEGTVVTDRSPYADDTGLCELFVALTEDNPIRRAVQRGDDLYELLMQPVDTEQIERDIERLVDERERLTDRLDELDQMADRLPKLRRQANAVTRELDAVRADLEAKREAVTEREAQLENQSGERSELAERRERRAALRDRLSTHRAAIDSLEAELGDVTDELATVEPEVDDADTADIEAELERLHSRKQELTSTVNALGSIVSLNEEVLDGTTTIPEALRPAESTPRLDRAAQSVTCWTCGTTVERARITDQLGTVREVQQEKRAERESVTRQIETLTERKEAMEAERAKLDRLQERKAELQAEVESRRESVSQLESELRSVERDIERLQDADGEDTELGEYYEAISELEYERGRLTSERDEIEAEIENVESALADREQVVAERESVTAELRAKRQRIDRIERELVDTFNETMEQVLDTLAYDAVERIWFERRAAEGDSVSETSFELHVVRATEAGVAYDDTVESLSKSERAVVGLIVALAGYLVHDVGASIPFIIVDAVEMFDADRIRGLLDHFGDHAEYVVAAVLPEDGARLSETYDRVTTTALAAEP